MVERFNGKPAYTRRTHGSERRGVFPVPNLNYISQLEQSKQDNERRLKRIQKQREAHLAEFEGVTDLGNKELPVYKHKQELLANIDAYKATIVGGATGSGKSTQLPQYLYEAGYDMTVVLVPRRVIADGLGERIREELSNQIADLNGEEAVGIIHGERSERHDDNRIQVMTPNTFVKMQKEFEEKFSDKRVAIISDEIHEANLFTEIATGSAAIAVNTHDNWRLVAASATHNASTLQKPFQALNKEPFVPTVEIEGRPFQVELREDPEHTSMDAYVLQGDIHEKSMIFTSGKREIDHIIKETQYALEKNQTGASKKVIFRKLHGDLTEIELAHINDPVPKDSRLVIVSSPAGMSGITIPGVTLVITDGTINRSELDDDGAEGLKRHYLSRAGITQQIGRAGRDVPGGIGILAKPTTIVDDFIRRRGGTVDIPQMAFLPFADKGRMDHEPPEIYNTNLSGVVLSVAASEKRFANINEFIPHPVEPSGIITAEEALSRLGSLNDEDRVTPIGRAMNSFPLIPELARGVYEASRPGRSLQHMARAAFIAAAINVGGLQNFDDKDVKEWTKLIRPTTNDDFIAQLDLMMAADEAIRTDEDSVETIPISIISHGIVIETAEAQVERTPYEFAETYTLHPKRIQKARKAARKILNSLKINLDNIVVMPPLPQEEQQLRDDFTSGMIDLVYEEVGKAPRTHKTLYRNILGGPESKTRLISDRSTFAVTDTHYVAGIPRWYETENKRDKTKIRHDVIDHVLTVNPAIVGKYAQENQLLVSKDVGWGIEGDRAFEYEQQMFGSIAVDGPVKSTRQREQIPENTRRVLVKSVLENPKEKQIALRNIAEELELYNKRIPANDLNKYRRAGAPEDITKETIEALIQEIAKSTRSLSEIDEKLGQYLYSRNLSINKYFDSEIRTQFKERSPDFITIDGEQHRLFYDQGQPYITRPSRQKSLRVNGPVHLNDGREVLVQIPESGGGTRRVSFGFKSLEV